VNISVHLGGFEEMRRELGKLSTRMVDAAARKAVRRAARPVVLQARANLAALALKDSTGLLSRSIGVKVKKYKGSRRPVRTYSAEEARALAASGVTVAIVGARRSFVQTVLRRSSFIRGSRQAVASVVETREYLKPVSSVPANYAHLIEGGVRPHTTGKGSSLRSGKSGGVRHPGFAAKPWLNPAIDAKREESRRIMAESFAEDLRAEAARVRAKVNSARARAA